MRRIRILISLFIIMMMGFASCSKANSETQSVRSEPLQGRILFKWGGFERDPKISMSGNGICVYQNGKMEKFWHRGSGGKWVNGKVLMSPSDLAIKDPVTGKNIMEEYLVDFLTKKNIRKITIKHSGIIRCFSKDEKYIFGTVHEPTDKEWIWIENVFKYNTETGEFKKLTDFKEPGNFIPTIDLSPDETKLLFDHQIKKTDTKSQ
ncbi:MAG: hypothetical protein HZC17_08060, partial [Candidatus Omnitrophica bacterium]|nr:hypothetical protein [Candidatus Omnitrophota bacterium]